MSLDFVLKFDIDTGNEPYACVVFDVNIPSFISPMLKKAEIYDALYNSKGKKASDIIPDLTKAIEFINENETDFNGLFSNPRHYWVVRYYLGIVKIILEECIKYPKAIINSIF